MATTPLSFTTLATKITSSDTTVRPHTFFSVLHHLLPYTTLCLTPPFVPQHFLSDTTFFFSNTIPCIFFCFCIRVFDQEHNSGPDKLSKLPCKASGNNHPWQARGTAWNRHGTMAASGTTQTEKPCNNFENCTRKNLVKNAVKIQVTIFVKTWTHSS